MSGVRGEGGDKYTEGNRLLRLCIIGVMCASKSSFVGGVDIWLFFVTAGLE